MMEPSQFRDLVMMHCQTGRVESNGDLDVVHRLGTVICDRLQAKLDSLLRINRTRPVLCAYLSDGWGAKVSSRCAITHGDHVVVRHGKVRHDFLLERGIFRMRRPDGESDIAFLTGPPRGLSKGKSAWNMFSAACEFQGSTRVCGHEGIIINVVLQDGMLFEPVFRMMRSIRALYYEADSGVDLGHEHVILQNTEWTIGVKCKSHGCHNAFVWGLKWWNIGQMSEDCHITIASLRNSAQALHGHIDELISRCLKFEAKDTPRSDLVAWWSFLDIAANMLELFIEVDPRWNGEHLCVAATLEADEAVWSKVSSVVLYCFRWFDWSDSRWLRAGKASRYYIRSLACGLQGAVRAVSGDAHASKYHLNGHSRSTFAVRRFFCIAGVAALPADCVHVELMADDRLLRRGTHMQDLMHEKLRYLTNLPKLVWERCAHLVGSECSWQDLRHWGLQAAFTAVGYMQRDVFDDLKRDPFCLTQGDIAANLQELCTRTTIIGDHTTQQIKTLLDLGYPSEALASALALLRDTPCSVNTVEQGHASGAVLMREHEQYTEKALKARANLHQVRALVEPRSEDKVMLWAQNKLDRLARKRPSATSGRSMYLQKMVKEGIDNSNQAVQQRYHHVQGSVAGHSQLYFAVPRHEKVSL